MSNPSAVSPDAAAPPKSGCCSCGRKASDFDESRGMLRPEFRKTRNLLCLIIFIVFWIGMIGVGIAGLKFGHWQRLVYGTDYKGQICGYDDAVASKRYIAYPRSNEDFIANLGKSSPLEYKFYGICVSSCPSSLSVLCNYNAALDAVTDADKVNCISGVSSTSTPVGSSGLTCYDVNTNCWIIPQATSSVLFRCIPMYNVTNTLGTTCTFPPGITDGNDPRCYVVSENRQGVIERPARPNILFDQLNTGRAIWGRWFGDLAKSWWVILLCSVGLAVLLGFVFVSLLKYFTRCMVWTVIFLLLILLTFLTGFFYYNAGLISSSITESFSQQLSQFPATNAIGGAIASASSKAQSLVPQEWSTDEEQMQRAYRAIAYISTAVTIIVFALVIFSRAQIARAIEVIKLGSEALRALPGLLIFPCTNILALGALVIGWVFVAAALASAGEITTEGINKQFTSGLDSYIAQYNIPVNVSSAFNSIAGANSTITSYADMPVLNYLMIYHVFGLLWTVQFVQGMACMTVAGAVCAWYYSKLNKEAEEANPELTKYKYPLERFPIMASLWRTIRYYMGSVAFGSFLIALIQFIRLVMAYIQRKMQQAQKDNNSIKFIFCCIQSCLACLQKCVEVVSRNAYIFVALKGDGFMGAGGRVFKLIFNHGREFVIVNALGEIIMFLGKVLIAVTSAWASYILLENVTQFKYGGTHQLSSTWLPTLVTLFFAYACASGFMMVFDLSVDSILVCYCTDIDENKSPVHVEHGKVDIDGKLKKQKQAEEKEADAKKGDAPKQGNAPTVA